MVAVGDKPPSIRSAKSVLGFKRFLRPIGKDFIGLLRTI